MELTTGVCSVVFVHDLYNQPEPFKRLEGIIATACEKENDDDGRAAETTFHVCNYRLSRSSIRDKAKFTAYVSDLGKRISLAVGSHSGASIRRVGIETD